MLQLRDKQRNLPLELSTLPVSGTIKHVGTWRSLVACLHGAQEVPGSNPGVPTSTTSHLLLHPFFTNNALCARRRRKPIEGIIRSHNF